LVVVLAAVAGGIAGALVAGHPEPSPPVPPPPGPTPSTTPSPLPTPLPTPLPSHAPRTLCAPDSLHIAANQQHTSCVQAATPGQFASPDGWRLAHHRFGPPEGSVAVNIGATTTSFIILPSGHAAVPTLGGEVVVMAPAAEALAGAPPEQRVVDWPVARRLNESTTTLDLKYAVVTAVPLHAAHVHTAGGVAPTVIWWTTMVQFGGTSACLLWAALLTPLGGNNGSEARITLAEWAPFEFGTATDACNVASVAGDAGVSTAEVTVRQLPAYRTGSVLVSAPVQCTAPGRTAACTMPTIAVVPAGLPPAIRNVTHDGRAHIKPLGRALSPTALLPPNDTHVALFAWLPDAAIAASFDSGMLAVRDTGWTDFKALSEAAVEVGGARADAGEAVVDLTLSQLYVAKTTLVGTIGLGVVVLCVPLANTSAPCPGWPNASVVLLPAVPATVSSACLALGPLPGTPPRAPARSEPGTLLFATLAGAGLLPSTTIVVLNASDGGLLDSYTYTSPSTSPTLTTSIASCPTIVRDGLAPGAPALVSLAGNGSLLVFDASPGALSARGLLWSARMCNGTCATPGATGIPPGAFTNYLAFDAAAGVYAVTYDAAQSAEGYPVGVSALLHA